MTDETDPPLIVDFESRRRERLHLVHEARLQKMRGEFERALPLPGKATARTARSAKKKNKPRKS